MSKWTTETAKAMIERNGGKIGADKNIRYSNPGIAVLGAIDYLRKLGYRWANEA